MNKVKSTKPKGGDKIGLSLAALIPLTLSPQQAMAQLSIVVSASQPLNFGTFTAGAAGGTVEIATTTGNRTVTGTVTTVAGGAIESQGFFSVSGSTGLAMDVSVTATSFNITNGGDTMVVNNFELITDNGGPNNTITLATNPSTFQLGGTLVVSAGQTEGTYVGNYMLSVNYQ